VVSAHGTAAFIRDMARAFASAVRCAPEMTRHSQRTERNFPFQYLTRSFLGGMRRPAPNGMHGTEQDDFEMIAA